MGLSGVTPLWPSFANFPKAQASSRSTVLGEFFNVLVRKAGKSRSEVRDALLSWRDTFSVVEASSEAMPTAADLAMDHQLGIWDVVTLSVAAQGGAVCFCPRTWIHLGRGDGGQSFRFAATCPRQAVNS